MDKQAIIAFEEKVKKTILDYKLLNKDEKILVAASGGKDSTTILHLLHKWGYNIEAISIDLHIGDYSKNNVQNVKDFCKKEGIKLNLIDLREEMGSSVCFIREGVQAKQNISNCTVCGVIKRWLLNKKAKELNADKLVTGHNLNDESETVMLNLIKGNPEFGRNIGPSVGSERGDARQKGFVQRIKPLYFCTNKEISEYSKAMGFPVLYEACPCSQGVLRRKLREQLAKIDEEMPDARLNMVNNFMAVMRSHHNENAEDCAVESDEASDRKINACEVCGEPARNKVCRLCEMIKLIKSPSGKDKANSIELSESD